MVFSALRRNLGFPRDRISSKQIWGLDMDAHTDHVLIKEKSGSFMSRILTSHPKALYVLLLLGCEVSGGSRAAALTGDKVL